MNSIESLVDKALEEADSCGRGQGFMNGAVVFLVQPDNSLVKIGGEIPLSEFDPETDLD